MKVLVLTEYPPSAAGLATQGQLLCRGLREIGVDVHQCILSRPRKRNGTTAGSSRTWWSA